MFVQRSLSATDIHSLRPSLQRSLGIAHWCTYEDGSRTDRLDAHAFHSSNCKGESDGIQEGGGLAAAAQCTNPDCWWDLVRTGDPGL